MSPLSLLLLPLLSSVVLVRSCNEAICASIVSKCQVMDSCNCEIVPDQPCTCCDRCHKCLGDLHAECCSCVKHCPSPNVTELASR